MDLLSYAASSLLPPVFLGFFHGGALIFMLLYLWSRQNPEAQVGGWVAGRVGGGGWVGGWLGAVGRVGSVLDSAAPPARQAFTCHPPTHPPCWPACPCLQISMFGIIKLNGKHLPFAFLALDLLMNQDIWTDVMGILCGHV